ncbi:DUF3823 domain-containing protein [Pedobacter polaris]|uniref:DUF3823 domain-containing protein n=1 Tax=Pedobacter polaris TaxID=2571273 RepID=A0A4U1CVT5_9SPHI|nr:DUF3823 domain-containing protein [Pedobacter polaris]TKC12816.1 DUF3823 domain-containing protein [Pedobacter polaris]
MKKRIIYYIAICLATLSASSCSKFDNYDAPDQTLKGTVTDVNTGKAVQTEVTGDNTAGTRIKIIELSWSPTATPQFLASFQDGTYINTKIFAGTYRMTVEGAFVPLVQTTPVVDNGKTVEVRGGTTTVDFAVEPFLRVEWVGEPVLNANGTVTATYKITRGTANPLFQQNITDAYLFANGTKYVGNNNFMLAWSTKTTYAGNAANALLGTNQTITTPVLPKTREVYLRIGARIAFGANIYNYNEVKMITVP